MPLVLHELSEVIASDTNVESEVNARELGQVINSFIRELPVKEGNVFIRRYFYAESIAEIAQRYHISTNNVTVMLSRTRSKLKNHLQEEGYM